MVVTVEFDGLQWGTGDEPRFSFGVQLTTDPQASGVIRVYWRPTYLADDVFQTGGLWDNNKLSRNLGAGAYGRGLSMRSGSQGNPSLDPITFVGNSGWNLWGPYLPVTMTPLTGEWMTACVGVDVAGFEYYSNVLRIRRSSLPILSTTPVYDITSDGFSSGGQMSYGGGSTVTEIGVVVLRESLGLPLITSFDGKYNPTPGTGDEGEVWTVSGTGLISDTWYNARAFATNSLGTGYGTNYLFKTGAESLHVWRYPMPYPFRFLRLGLRGQAKQ